MATAKTTKAVRGAQLRAHFRNAMATEAALDSEACERLANRLTTYVSSARFRSFPPDVAIKAIPAATALESARPGAAASGVDGEAAFDPYAFSVVALLAKDGDLALMEALNRVKGGGNLKSLARAQRLSLPRTLLDNEGASEPDLRQAILEAGKKRLANRQAAAG